MKYLPLPSIQCCRRKFWQTVSSEMNINWGKGESLKEGIGIPTNVTSIVVVKGKIRHFDASYLCIQRCEWKLTELFLR